jgi:hypothetical protein
MEHRGGVNHIARHASIVTRPFCETGDVHVSEIETIARSLAVKVLDCRTIAGGFSHETCLLALTDGHVVARLGGSDPAIEAAVMVTAAKRVPVPQVLAVLPAAGLDARPMMALEYVAGTPLSEVLDRSEPDDATWVEPSRASGT